MTDIGSSIMVASMIVGMLTVPAASKTINSSNPVLTDLPNISGSESVPKQVVTNSSSDSFTRKVETAFNEFETRITSERAKTSVESAGSSLNIEKSPEETVWKLRSSKGDLVVKKSSSKTVEKVETPQGTLKTVRQNGGVAESFEGADREAVEDTAQELRELMEDRKNKIEQRRTKTVSGQYARSLEIQEVNGSNDFVKIKSSSSQQIDLDGWKLSEDHGEVTFGEDGFKSAQIPPNGELYVYSETEDKADVEEEEDAIYLYDSGLGWDSRSNGDVATLWNNGEKVAEKGY